MSSLAVEVAVIFVYLAMRCKTIKFCTTSSRVGQTHSACGTARAGSTRASMPKMKHVVFPLPLCAYRPRVRSSIRA
jgi:hypothetical protein